MIDPNKQVVIQASYVIEKCDVTFYTSDANEPLPLWPADGRLTVKPSDLLGPTPQEGVEHG